MTFAGLDVGSRTIALVFTDGINLDSTVVDTGTTPLQKCRQLLEGKHYERLMVTGYGRHLVAPALQGEVISEIGAHSAGVKNLYPDCRTYIDIGGQDSKVISFNDDGGIRKFEMNDRCSAGTGKFLEVMAGTLEVGIHNLGSLALTTNKVIRINSLCTVFAESEVISLIARGEETNAIALALHEAIATRITGMIRRIGIKRKIVFAGGGALNRCLQTLIGDKLGMQILVPEEPQIIGALGAALLAAEKGKLKESKSALK